MSKLLNQPICCLTNKQDIPARVERQGRMIRVAELLDQWADTGEWWNGESEKMFYRVRLESGSLLEIYKDLVTGQWWTYKIYD